MPAEANSGIFALERPHPSLWKLYLIRSILTGIKTSSDKARANLDAMIASLQEKLDRIDALVAEADESVPD